MHLGVVVPSEDHLATAGVRIRYQRIAAEMAALGHRLSVTVLDDVRLDRKPLADAYLLSKCHDARACVLAQEIRAMGRHCGVDFFDDYYSQARDSRFVHIRAWLRGIAPFLTFALCSTPPLRKAIASLLPGLPCHVLNDPAPGIDVTALAANLNAKRDRLAQTGIIDIGWFGIGANRHFPLGLSDLAAFGGHLSVFRQEGLAPRLSILTNTRAMTAERLESLKRLPVPWRIEEWSPEAEVQLLAEAQLCFLPVNAQPFSTMKSLNRALTALTSGAQVLSAGYPLYDSLGDFIYRDGASLLGDFRSGALRLRPATLQAFAEALCRHGDSTVEAGRLAGFLEALPPPPAVARQKLIVLHGRQSHGLVHKFVQRMGHLSATGPWTETPGLNYDLRIGFGDAGEPLAVIARRALPRLRAGLADLAKPAQRPADRLHLMQIPLAAVGAGAAFTSADPLLNTEAGFLASYDSQIGALEDIALRLFGPHRIVVSELAAPFWRGTPPAPARDAA